MKFPPSEFPIHCSFLVSKRNSHVADELKDLVKDMPKDDFRFRKTENRYVGVSVNVFLKDADSMRPIANGLQGKGLFVDTLGGSDKRVFGRDLVKMAQEAIRENYQGVGR